MTTTNTTYTKDEIKTLQAYAKMECERLEKEYPDIKELNISDGNKKLVPNAGTAFIIWNLPAVITCPYATEHCKQFCYATKAEKAYPQVLPSRMANFNASKQNDFSIRLLYTILKVLAKSRKNNLVVRIHESGDFYNKRYADIWLNVARKITDKRVKFMAYTKSFKFFDGEQIPANFSLRASIWDDTKETQKEIVARNAWPIYTAVEHFTSCDNFTQCRCSDCATCGK